MRLATMIDSSQTREGSNCLRQLQYPLSARRTKKTKRIQFIHLNGWKFIKCPPSLPLFLFLFLSAVLSGFLGVWGKTGKLQRGQGIRPGPLKEMPHRRETSTSQVWFRSGWHYVCVCVCVSVCVYTYLSACV